MLAPTEVHRYACPCGRLVLEVAGPSWMAWDLAAARAAEHAETCELARGRWIDAPPENPPPGREAMSAVRAVESAAHLDRFAALPDDEEDALETAAAGALWR